MNEIDKSNSESQNSISEMQDFDEDNEKLFPHHTGFPKDIIKHSNNFFNAALHCLTNIYDLTGEILDCKPEKEYPYIFL